MIPHYTFIISNTVIGRVMNMDKIRVYEAAKKLKMETAELVDRLAKIGIKVKSPIASISLADSDKAVAAFAADKNKGKPDKTKVEAKQPVASAKEVKKSNLSIVKTPENKKPEKAAVIALERPAKEEKAPKIVKKEEPAAKKVEKKEEKVEKVEAPKPVAPVVVEVKKDKGIMSFIAVGLAAAAVLAVLVLDARVKETAASLNNANSVAATLKGDLALLSEDGKENLSMILENRDAVSDVETTTDVMQRVRASDDLLKNANSLKELSSTAPAETAQRLEKLSEGLRNLALSI